MISWTPRPTRHLSKASTRCVTSPTPNPTAPPCSRRSGSIRSTRSLPACPRRRSRSPSSICRTTPVRSRSSAKSRRTLPRTCRRRLCPFFSAPAPIATTFRPPSITSFSAANSSPPIRPISPRSARARCTCCSSSRPRSPSLPAWRSPTLRCTRARAPAPRR